MTSQSSLVAFLKKVDNDFCPSLSSKVSLCDYADKILEKAELIMEGSSDNIKGLVVLYCNNTEKRTAYIPLVGVTAESRGEGIATRMMKKAIKIAELRGMKRIQIHSNNPIAIKLYQNLGFCICEEGERKLLELYL